MRRVDGNSFRDRVDARIGSELDRRLVDRLVGTGGRARRVARVASYLMATAVYAALLCLLVAGGALLLLGDNWVQRALGVLPLLPMVALLLPRRSDEVLHEVGGEAAPTFTALLAEVAQALGTQPPTYVAVSEDINAFAGRRGLRERRLVVGAPLWAALDWPGRLALLGHELGHFSNRDVVHGRYVWWAVVTVSTWIDLLTPHGLISTEGRTPVFATLTTAPLRLPLVGYISVMWKVHAAASRHDELRADTAAAALAGTPGVVEMLESILLSDLIDVAANRAAIDPRRPDLELEIRTRIEGVSEAARRALPASGEESSVDRTHPSTIDRLRLQESLPPAPPTITMDDDRVARIEAELRPMTAAALKRTADGYRHVW